MARSQDDQVEIIKILEPSDIERLKAGPAFRNIGKYVEDVVVELFGRFVPPAYMYRNPVPWDSTESGHTRWEIADVLFWQESTLLIVECKARQISRAGDLRDYEKLDKWLSKTLSDAQKQALRAEKYLKGPEVLLGKQGDFAVIADLSRIENVIPAVVVFEVSDFFWQPRIRERKRKYPQVQLFDLRGLYSAVNIISSSNDFLDYLRQKHHLNQVHPDFIPYEENLLAFYLANGKSLYRLWNTSNQKELYREFAKGLP